MMKTLPTSRAAGLAHVESPALDTTTILENLVLLDLILDEVTRRELDSIPYVELSKHMRIRSNGDGK